MRRAAAVVSAIVVVSLASIGCSSPSFDIGQGSDTSTGGDSMVSDTAADTTTSNDTTTQNDATSPVDSAPDAIAGKCPPKPPCTASACGPLRVRDLEAMSAKDAPDFDSTGFRCKALTLCGVEMTCSYFDKPNMLGSLQSQEAMFYDGSTPAIATATKLRVGTGAASSCGSSSVVFEDGDFITVKFDGGKQACIFLPPFNGTEVTLYVAADGSTYFDPALTKPAKIRP